MTGTEIYKRTPSYERTAESIRLHAPEWKLLLAFDGQRSLAEVALSAETPFAEALPLTDKFLSQDWIEEQPITLDQYLKRTGAANASVGAAVTPAVVLHKPKPEPTPPAIVPPPVPVSTPPPVPPPVPPSLAVPPAPPPVPVSAPKTTAIPALRETATLPRATVAKPRPRGPMRLSAVVDYVVSQVGNSSLGRLMVYRIFLRVPPQLLQAEDIVSVHLVSDPSLVRTEPLKEAIAAAVNDVLKKALPDSVFAPA